MIETKDQAYKHASHVDMRKYKHVVCLPDGVIYGLNKDEDFNTITKTADTFFVLKGGVEVEEEN